MPLPWQTHFLPLSKNVSCTSTPKGKHLCQISWELVKNWGSQFAMQDFPPIFAIICRYHGNTLSTTVKKCVLHIYTPRQTSVPNFMRIGEHNWGSSSRRQDFPPIFAIICRYHGNTLSTTVKKCVLHIYTPRQTSVPNFMRIGEKLRK